VLLPIVIPTQCLQFDTPAPRKGHPFALRVSAHDAGHGTTEDLTVTLHAVATPLEADGFPVLLTAGSANLYYEAPRPLAGPVLLRLILFDGADIGVPAALPPVRGTVARLRLLEEHVHWDATLRAWHNDPDDPSRRRLVDIDVWPYRHLWWPGAPHDDEADHWEATSVVVDLDVPCAQHADEGASVLGRGSVGSGGC
jgi:hypothetical protein